MMKQFKMFMQDEEGASAVEYGLLGPSLPLPSF